MSTKTRASIDRVSRWGASALLVGLVTGCCGETTTVRPEPPLLASAASPSASASAPSVASIGARPRVVDEPRGDEPRSDADLDALIYPIDAPAPTSYQSKTEPLGATREQLLDLVMRFARSHGKAVTEEAVRQALDEPSRYQMLEPAKSPSRWGTLCRELGLIKEEPLDLLCKGYGDWLPTVLVVDFDQDGSDEFVLFGTWSVAAHQDELLGLYARQGDGLQKRELPDAEPFNVPEAFHHYGHEGFLRRTPRGLLLTDSALERWDGDGEALGHAPSERPVARTHTETREYLITRGRPRLVQTRIEDWDEKHGTRTRLVKAQP